MSSFTPIQRHIILITGGYDHSIKIWDILNATCINTIPFSESQVNSLAINEDKKYLAAAGYSILKLFDLTLERNTPFLSFDAHSGNIRSVGFQKNSKWLFTAAEDGTLKLWDTRVQRCQRSIGNKSNGMVTRALLHPNQSEIFFVTSTGYFRVWDLSTNTFIENLHLSKNPLDSISISNDASKMLISGYDGMIYKWNNLPPYSSEIRELSSMKIQNKYLLRTLLSPDGKAFASFSSDTTLRILDMISSDVIMTLSGHQSWVWDGAYSIDSSYLFSASTDGTARLWDLTSKQVLKVYTGHKKGITTLALNDYNSLYEQ